MPPPPGPMPPPIGKPEKVAMSIHACETGGLTTCCGGDCAWAVAQAVATAKATTALRRTALVVGIVGPPCEGSILTPPGPGVNGAAADGGAAVRPADPVSAGRLPPPAR